MQLVSKKLKKLLETFSKNPVRIFTPDTLERKETELEAHVQELIGIKVKDQSEQVIKNECVKLVTEIRRRIRIQRQYLTNNCRSLVPYKVQAKKMSVAVPPPPFFKEGDELETFLDSVESYFKVSGTDDSDNSKKKDLLAYLLGPSLKKVKDFLSPVDFSTKSYADLVNACKAALSSGLKKHQAYIKFFTLKQSNSELVNGFALSIKAIAKTAQITDEILIVNRIIDGLKDDKMKFELLKQKITKFDELMTQLTFLEVISEASSSKVENVNKIRHSKNPRKYEQNKNKSYKNTDKEKKYPKKGTCNYCKKPGHWKAQCYKLKNKSEEKKLKNNKDSDLPQSLGSLYLGN